MPGARLKSALASNFSNGDPMKDVSAESNGFTPMNRLRPAQIAQLIGFFLSILLAMNLFKILFIPPQVSSGFCGTLLQPVLDVEEDDHPMGSIFDTTPFAIDPDLYCPRGMFFLWNEFTANILLLAVFLATTLVLSFKSSKR